VSLTRQVAPLHESGSITEGRRRSGRTAQCYRHHRRRAAGEFGELREDFWLLKGRGGSDIEGNVLCV